MTSILEVTLDSYKKITLMDSHTISVERNSSTLINNLELKCLINSYSTLNILLRFAIFILILI